MKADMLTVNNVALALCCSALAFTLYATIEGPVASSFVYAYALAGVAVTLCVANWKVTTLNAAFSFLWVGYVCMTSHDGDVNSRSLLFDLVVFTVLSGLIIFIGAKAERALADCATREHCLRMALQAADQTNEALRRSAKQKDEFLAVLSHELRNPLSAIWNAAELILVRSYNRDVRSPAELLHRQLRQIKHLLDDLLDVARMNRGLMRLKCKGQDIRLCVQSAIDANAHHVEASRQSLEIAMPAHPVDAFADGARVVQIITNLVNNATKYAGPGAAIKIAVIPLDHGVQISVRDNGKGVDPVLLPHLFDPYHANPGEPCIQGLGLGLWISRGLARMHGGNLTATSEGPGKGVEFTLYLPKSPGGLLALRASDIPLADMRPSEAT